MRDIEGFIRRGMDLGWHTETLIIIDQREYNDIQNIYMNRLMILEQKMKLHTYKLGIFGYIRYFELKFLILLEEGLIYSQEPRDTWPSPNSLI